MMIRLTLALLLLTFAGCQQARSFLHMNSDSPTPFMGFELSVDARDAKQDNVVSLRNVGRDKNSGGTPITTARAETKPRKFTLPLLDLTSNPGEAAEVEDILARIAGS